MSTRRLLSFLLLSLLVLASAAAQEEQEQLLNDELIEHRIGAEVGGLMGGGMGAVYTYTPVITPLWRLHLRGGLALSIPAIAGPGFHIPLSLVTSGGSRIHRVEIGAGLSVSPNAVDEDGTDLGFQSYLHAILAYRLTFQEDRTVLRAGAVSWSTPAELSDGDIRILPAISLETAVR